MKKTVIGIDPDTQKHGVAIYRDRELTDLKMMDLMELMSLIQSEDIGLFLIENVAANNFIYSRNRQNQDRVNQAIARKIGMCQQATHELVRMLDYYGQKYQLVPPSKFNWAKDKKRFQKMTGWRGRSNEDTRSAAYFGFLGLYE